MADGIQSKHTYYSIKVEMFKWDGLEFPRSTSK